MDNNEHRDIDEKILSAVAGGCRRFQEIQLRLHDDIKDFRKIDRRLQALRKGGRLIFTARDGWTAPKEKSNG